MTRWEKQVKADLLLEGRISISGYNCRKAVVDGHDQTYEYWLNQMQMMRKWTKQGYVFLHKGYYLLTQKGAEALE